MDEYFSRSVGYRRVLGGVAGLFCLAKAASAGGAAHILGVVIMCGFVCGGRQVYQKMYPRATTILEVGFSMHLLAA